ncbi:hypothetical protein SK128_025006 [Halocaridina rubra]|uniref:Protein MIS12 homolog n=1 Tax=Halocaridina rubra TaxID=373956 RepID=A0AAN8X2G9_HALRR
MAEGPNITNEEYETNFFGFPPSIFFAEVKAIISDRLCEGLDLVEKKLQEIPDDVLPQAEVKQGVDTLRDCTESNFSKTCQKLESYVLGNVMKIPPHVLLPSDVDQAVQVPISGILSLQTEIDTLHLQIKYERRLQAKCKEELEDIQGVLQQQQMLLDDELSARKISNLQIQKENHKFFQENAEEIKVVSGKIQEAMKDPSLECNHLPSKYLAESAWK